MDIRYIAGFVDGEGCFNTRVPRGRRKPRYRIEVPNTYLPVLLEIYQFFQCGTVKPKPVKQNGRNRRQWRWVVEDRPSILRVLMILEPHLIEKRSLAQEMIAALDIRHR